jgi:hypothetical protein
MVSSIIKSLYNDGFCDEIKDILDDSSMNQEDKVLHYVFYYSCKLKQLHEQNLDTRPFCVEIKNFVIQNKETLKKVTTNILFKNAFSNTLYFLEVVEKHGLITEEEEQIVNDLILELGICDINITSYFIRYFNQLYSSKQFDLAKEVVKVYLSKCLSHKTWKDHPSRERLQPDIVEKLQKLGFNIEVDGYGFIYFLD